MKSQAETIKELSARSDGPDQFQRFDNAFRSPLTVPKSAVVREETRRKRARGKKRKEARLTVGLARRNPA